MNLRTGAARIGYDRLLRPMLFGARSGDPERIHESMIQTLARVGHSPAAVRSLRAVGGSRGAPTVVAGIRFPGRVGLAAGMDKDGVAAGAWQALGFCFAELGTVTALPQPGNDRPRVFRLRSSKALINRMGFNNHGAAALHRTLSIAGVYRGNGAAGIPLGISIGKSKVVALDGAVDDYLASFRLVAPHADYIAVNVSSPNTPGLRSLQDGQALRTIIEALVRESRQDASPTPLFVKVAPDLEWSQLDEVIEVATTTGVAGLIATNTTLARDGLHPRDQPLASEAGGLSGAPLTHRARQVVGYLVQHAGLPVIGSGGVMTLADATALFDLGAALVQLYTGFVYAGPALPAQINEWTRRSGQ